MSIVNRRPSSCVPAYTAALAPVRSVQLTVVNRTVHLRQYYARESTPAIHRKSGIAAVASPRSPHRLSVRLFRPSVQSVISRTKPF